MSVLKKPWNCSTGHVEMSFDNPNFCPKLHLLCWEQSASVFPEILSRFSLESIFTHRRGKVSQSSCASFSLLFSIGNCLKWILYLNSVPTSLKLVLLVSLGYLGYPTNWNTRTLLVFLFYFTVLTTDNPQMILR